MALTDKLTAIADAIRTKTGKTDALTLEQMVTEIEAISVGGSIGELIFVLGDGTQIEGSSVESFTVLNSFVQHIICGDEVLWQDVVPADYRRVRYLESTGTQYIDTGYTMTSDIAEYGIKANGLSRESSIFGAQDSETYTGVPWSTNGNSVSLFIGNSKNVATATFISNQLNTLVVQSTSASSGVLKLNNTSQAFNYSGGILKTLPIYLFANNIQGNADQLASSKVASFYIIDNGVKVRDFVPCYRKSDGEAGMYDFVTETFFTNAGTGEFLTGDLEVEIEELRQIIDILIGGEDIEDYPEITGGGVNE